MRCAQTVHIPSSELCAKERERPQLKTRKRSLGTDEPTPTAGEFTKEVLQTVYQAPPRSQWRSTRAWYVSTTATHAPSSLSATPLA